MHHRLDRFYRLWGTRLIHLIYNPDFTGFDKLPESGPVVLASNHVSYVDGLIIAAACKRPVRFVIYEPIYNMPVIHHFMQVNRAIPIRPTKQSVTHALAMIREALDAGDMVCIFPEGQLTYTGGLSRFKPGIEHIIRQNPVPVYPVALTGLWGSLFSRKFLGSWKRFVPRNPRHSLHVTCGEPLMPENVTVNRLQSAVLRLKYT